jgi:hypothetical protein
MSNGPLKLLSIQHQIHSNCPFYWNMNNVNTRSIPNYTRRIRRTRYIPKVSEMLRQSRNRDSVTLDTIQWQE